MFPALREVAVFQPRLIADALSALMRMGTEQAAFEYAMRLVVACGARYHLFSPTNSSAPRRRLVRGSWVVLGHTRSRASLKAADAAPDSPHQEGARRRPLGPATSFALPSGVSSFGIYTGSHDGYPHS
jgi:hypothetical protein